MNGHRDDAVSELLAGIKFVIEFFRSDNLDVFVLVIKVFVADFTFADETWFYQLEQEKLNRQ